MEIWAWVEQLQEDLREGGFDRLADLIDQIPDDVTNNRPDRVLAALPEALAAARGIKNPWLEVFLRHWGMQNRMSNLSEGESALSEATALLDFAHRKETQDCPQSICVTQDIAKCYGNVDGPGWAQERLAVCAETLARIDPTWPCFDCLSREYADALMDEGRAAEAIPYLAKQAQAMEHEGEEIGSRYRWQQAEALWLDGRLEEALTEYQAIDKLDDSESDDDRVSRNCDQACILAELGRFDEAFEILPAWDDLTAGDYYDWTAAAALLATNKPEANTWRLGMRLQTAMDHMIKVGSHRKALDIAVRHGKLAVARGVGMTAQRALEAAQGRLAKLRKPFGAPEKIQELAGLVATMPSHAQLPVPAEDLLAYLENQESRDPEQELEWLMSAHLQNPEDLGLALVAGDAMKAIGLLQGFEDHLWKVLEAHPDWRPVVYRLLQVVIGHDDEKALARLLFLVESVDRPTGCWIRASWAFHQERWKEVGEYAKALLALESDDDARGIWAKAAMREGNFELAVKLRKEQMAQREELDRDLCFDLMTAASADQDWDTVRETAAKMGMELDSKDGVVEENWGRAWIGYEEDGDQVRYMAVRTGPVTARILQPASPQRLQRAQDWVVFDAEPVEALPEDEEERKEFICTYRHIHTLEPGGFEHSWLLDGVEPDDDVYGVMRDALWEKDWACWVVSGPDYRVLDPEADESEQDDEGEDDTSGLPGILILVATPKTVPAKELHQTLKTLTKDFPHPLSWRSLAEHVGQDLAHHEAIEERYGL